MKPKLLLPVESWPNWLLTSVNQMIHDHIEQVDQERIDMAVESGKQHLSPDKFIMSMDGQEIGHMRTIIIEHQGSLIYVDYKKLTRVIVGGQLCYRYHYQIEDLVILLPIARVRTLRQMFHDWFFYKNHWLKK